jgi:D-alanyl-D-alanine carboxypeptidase/D-alanyl-D-alanine-endopeptidase (penicillin-binding protein 4)
MGREDYLSPFPDSSLQAVFARPLIAVVLAALAVAFPVGTTAAPAPLEARLGRALAVPNVSPSRTAALAVNLRSGEIVYARNVGRALAPASTEKLVVTYALLVRLGPSYRLETELLGEGEQVGGTWHGHLVLRGEGDPTLAGSHVRALARKVRSLGIRRVTGTVVGDESFFDARRMAPGWKASYFIEESPPLSALVVDRARSGRRVARQPALAAAMRLREALAEAGVSVGGRAAARRASADAVLLARRASPRLDRLLEAVNRRSDNFTAELLLKHLGAVERGRGTTQAGAAVVTEALAEAGIPLRGVRVVDGSGLSLADRLSAEALVGVLVAAWDDPSLRGPLLSSLAVAGRNGTLQRRLREPGVAGRVVAKTGTTSGASTLAGFVGGRYAFAVLQNGSPVAYSWARRAQDRFVTLLARADRPR